jgi:hypothetical protein
MIRPDLIAHGVYNIESSFCRFLKLENGFCSGVQSLSPVTGVQIRSKFKRPHGPQLGPTDDARVDFF